MKRTALILTLICIAAFIIWIYPATSFKIDGNWWIVCRFSDDYDPLSAGFLEDAYGCSIIDLEANHDFNAFGQSFIFVGGSEAFGEEAPWAEEFLAITKPSTQPDVKWIVPSTFDTAYIQTPKGNFHASDGSYGMITKAYDYTLRRWIVIAIGLGPECTAAGTHILVMKPSLVTEHNWIIYEYLGNTVPLNSWTLSTFSNYEITATS
jgi:hypothetical protein